MHTQLPPVFTLKQAAESLVLDEALVAAELESGRLRGVKVGESWRTTSVALNDFLRTFPTAGESTSRRVENRKMPDGGADAANRQVKWEPTEPFQYRWPTASVQPAWIEDYSKGFRGMISETSDYRDELQIGFTTRKAAGVANRPRVTIFFARVGLRRGTTTRYPLVEFAGATDFDTSHRLASVIKLQDGTQLKQGNPIPAEYAGFETAVYSEIVTGPFASNGIAVVVAEDDLNGMGRHALIRLAWKRERGDGRF